MKCLKRFNEMFVTPSGELTEYDSSKKEEKNLDLYKIHLFGEYIKPSASTTKRVREDNPHKVNRYYLYSILYNDKKFTIIVTKHLHYFYTYAISIGDRRLDEYMTSKNIIRDGFRLSIPVNEDELISEIESDIKSY